MLVNLVPSAMDFATRHKLRAEPQKKSVPIAPDAIDPVTRTTLSLEYASLQHRDHCPLGMYVVPSPESLLVWDAVFFVHQGYYADAILKFRLTFPSNYPESPPTVQFVTDVVFHPLISHTGIFNLAPRFRPWRPKEHRVFDVLHWIKAAFKKQALDGIRESDCLNKEAYRLYHETTSSFAGLASQSSLLSQSAPALFDRDHPTLRGKPRDALPFRELAPDQLQTMRTKIGLKEWQKEPQQS
ncbi:ubiquitin-conjugating enzyme/RWD-like protein [Mycena haematopus]|nr:ubiquitin-conjugating enzyme/RWD-like protein [Mycena haematopus]